MDCKNSKNAFQTKKLIFLEVFDFFNFLISQSTEILIESNFLLGIYVPYVFEKIDCIKFFSRYLNDFSRITLKTKYLKKLLCSFILFGLIVKNWLIF